MAKIKREIKRKRVGQGSSTLRGTSSTHNVEAVEEDNSYRSFIRAQDTAASTILEISRGNCHNALNGLFKTALLYQGGITHATYRGEIAREPGRPTAMEKARRDTFARTGGEAYEAVFDALEDFRKRCVIK